MKTFKKALLVVFGVAAALWIGAAIVIRLHSSPGSYADTSTTPLGGLIEKAVGVSRLKDFMGELRAVYPAFVKYAENHQDGLPKTVADLKPYLPAQLAGLTDEAWELPSTGKMTPLIRADTAADHVLLQQKNLPPGKPKIVVFADGHIEYKR